MHFMSHSFPFKFAFIFGSYDALFSSSGCFGYACLHLCVFVSVITIASCAADKSLGEIKDSAASAVSSPADASHTDRYISLMQIIIINISLKPIPHSGDRFYNAHLLLLWLTQRQLLLLQHDWMEKPKLFIGCRKTKWKCHYSNLMWCL